MRQFLTTAATATGVVLALALLAGCDDAGRADSDGSSSADVGEAPQGYGPVTRHTVVAEKSLDNKAVLTSYQTLATVDAIENSTNVKAVTRMTDYKGAYEADYPRVSPDGTTVLYQLREEGGNINLWTMSSETGTNKMRNTEGDYLNYQGAWSPKCDKILFSSNRTDLNSHLWEIKSFGGGGGLRRITDSREADFWVHESPINNEIIAYTRFQMGVPTVWTYDRRTYLSTQLRTGRQAQISPDGKKIVYSVFDDQEKHWNIWTMLIDGSQPTQLTSNDAENFSPAWHPTSKWIIFASNKGSVAVKNRSGEPTQLHNFDIWMMHVNGEHVSQLTVNGSDDDNPSFGPDGKVFYFSSNRGHGTNDSNAGTGRDIWRAIISDDVLSMDVGDKK